MWQHVSAYSKWKVQYFHPPRPSSIEQSCCFLLATPTHPHTQHPNPLHCYYCPLPSSNYPHLAIAPIVTLRRWCGVALGVDHVCKSV